MKPDSLSALSASAFLWLVAFPSLAVDKEESPTDFAIFSICKVEAHVAPGGGPNITIESGMGDGGFRIATTSSSRSEAIDLGFVRGALEAGTRAASPPALKRRTSSWTQDLETP